MTDRTLVPVTEERRRQTRQLLAAMDDWIPSPPITRLYRGAEQRALEGDPYVADRQAGFAARAADDRHAAARRLYGQLLQLEREERERNRKPTDPPDPDEKEPWEAAKERLDRSSVGDLRPLLAELEQEAPFLHAAVQVVYRLHDRWGDGTRREVGPLLQQAANEGLGWLAARLPERIVVPPQPTELDVMRSRCQAHGYRGSKERQARDERIRELAAEGVPRKTLEAQFGLSQQQVSRICNGLSNGRHVATGAA